MSKRIAAVFQNLRSLMTRSGIKPGFRYISEAERRRLAALKRESIGRVIADRPAALLEHEERQQLAYWRLWRLVRPITAGAIPPELLDPSVPEHVSMALAVVGNFDAARSEPGDFADCLYRPVSDLPYSPATIRRCCEFLIGIADGDGRSLVDDRELFAKERDALGAALFSLDYFLDARAPEIPRRKLENLEFGKRRQLTGPTAVIKPRQGDVVVRSGFGATDSVDQVVGVSDNNEWMILTASGNSMQVISGAGAGSWNEVKIVAPAVAAGWLNLTPPFETVSLGI